MNIIQMPRLFYTGDKYEKAQLQKVCIDWGARKIRGSLPVKPEDNHPNIKKPNQIRVVWFSFDDVGNLLKVWD